MLIRIILKKKKQIPKLGLFLRNLNKNWFELRLFTFHARTIFEIIFLFVYTLEQGLLLFIISRIGIDLEIVSYFALIVLLTFGLHKIIMESRIKMLENEIVELKNENDIMNKEAKIMIDVFNEIESEYAKIKN